MANLIEITVKQLLSRNGVEDWSEKLNDSDFRTGSQFTVRHTDDSNVQTGDIVALSNFKLVGMPVGNNANARKVPAIIVAVYRGSKWTTGTIYLSSFYKSRTLAVKDENGQYKSAGTRVKTSGDAAADIQASSNILDWLDANKDKCLKVTNTRHEVWVSKFDNDGRRLDEYEKQETGILTLNYTSLPEGVTLPE